MTVSDTYDWEKLWEKPEPAVTPAPTVRVNGHGAQKYALAALASECDQLAATGEGQRNAALNTAAFRMGRHIGAGSIEPSVVRDALAAAAAATGLPATEIDLVLRQNDNGALAQGQAHPRHPAPLDPVPGTTVIEAAPDLAPDEEDAFWDRRPLLRHLHDYARARRTSPWAVLGVALARVATAVPPHYVLPAIVGGQASLNLFVGLVGTSGSGKGAAEQVAAEALDLGHIETHKTGSGEGIAHGYMRRERGEVIQHTEAVLFSVPEIDTLTALGGRQGATLLPELRSAWSGERLGFGYADPAKRLPVPAHQYRLCLVAGIQPARAAALLDDSDGGTPQRFLWLPAADPDAPDDPPPCPEPMAWDGPRFWSDHGFAAPSGRVEIGVCATARDTITRARVDRLRGTGDALDGHALLTRLKTAAALAVADQRGSVTDDDWDIAGVIMRKSEAVRAGVAATLARAKADANTGRAEAEAHRAVHVAERVEEAAVVRVSRKVVRILRRTGEPMSRSALRKGMDSRDRPFVDEAIERLGGVGQVVEEAFDYQGQNGTKYRLGEGV